MLRIHQDQDPSGQTNPHAGPRLRSALAFHYLGRTAAIWAGPPPVIRLTGRCLTEASALDGRCTQMVTLQIAEPFCPRDRLVGGVLHPFGHGDAAESADPSEQIPQKDASFGAICQVPHKRTVDLDRT